MGPVSRRDDVIGRPFWETPWWAASPEDRAQLHAIVRPWWGDRPLRRRGLPCRRRARHHGLPAGPVDRGRRGDRARAVRDRRHRSSQRGGAPPRLGRVRSPRSPSPRTPRTWPMPSAPTSPCRSARSSPASRSSTRHPRWCTSCNRGTSTPEIFQPVHGPVPGRVDAAHRRDPLGETVVVDNPAVNVKRYPHLAADTVAAGLTATASIPLRQDGGCRGRSASAGHDRSRRTPRSGPDSARWPTSPRARWPGRARRTPTPSSSTGSTPRWSRPRHLEGSLDVAVRYEPAGRGLGFGGDWYDIIPLGGTPPPSWSVTIVRGTASRRPPRWSSSAAR